MTWQHDLVKSHHPGSDNDHHPAWNSVETRTMTTRADASESDARHLHEITDQGYTIIEGLLDSGTLNSIRQALAPWLQGQQMGRNNFEGFQSERVYALLAKSPALAVIV